MSDTPETDELAALIDSENFVDRKLGKWIPVDFSQKLERERDEARILSEERYGYWQDSIKEYEEMREKWRATCSELEDTKFLLKQAQSALDAIHLEVGGWIKTMKENTD
jgi:hypothetical protein